MRHLATPDPDIFPTPKEWGTFIASRTDQFKMHSSEAQVKTALSQLFNNGVLRTSVYVYTWNSTREAWDEIYHWTRGTKKTDMSLFLRKATGVTLRKMRASDAEIAAAIKSIKGHYPEDHHGVSVCGNCRGLWPCEESHDPDPA